MKWLVAAALCAGCYRPGADPNCRIQCVEGAADNCPAGLDCIEGSCRNAAEPGCPDDAMIADAPIDTSINTMDSGFCVGSGMPLEVCLGGMPMNDLMVTSPTMFDTTTCPSLLVSQNQALCVYAYRTLTVRDTMRFVGPYPAVIVAVDVVVQVGGQITVAEDFAAQRGAGSDPSDCPQLSPGNSASIMSGGGGGGAGGSFGSFGGSGGSNTQGDGDGASSILIVTMPYTIRGGCSGSSGGNDDQGGSGGGAGHGAGAIAILASNTILVNGSVLAYGGGGRGANGSHAGGGGGGSGGLILLDATTISGNGRANANGGGGGAGGNDMIGGTNGDTVMLGATNTGGDGGHAATGGGEGGMGGAVGDASVGGDAVYGGGGGGGGGGVVLIRGINALANAYPLR